MLHELLALLSAGGATTREGMAAALGVGTREVDDMLERLESLGYLEKQGGDAASRVGGRSCAGCSSCSSCSGCALSPGQLPTIWQLSPKGRRALDADSA